MKSGDIVVIIIVLAAAVLTLLIPLLYGGQNADFVIVNGTRYDLHEDKIIKLENNGFHLTVNIENGLVYVSESDCPDGICKMSGKIGKNGRTIACVPAGIYIKIEGGGSFADSIAG